MNATPTPWTWKEVIFSIVIAAASLFIGLVAILLLIDAIPR
jgi:hypothetical protein